MTRPALRMCARCQRTTSEPALVHEVDAPTGPGFNVYACPGCAPHYPPLGDALELLEQTSHRSRLTLRVYKVDAEGTMTENRCRTEILADEHAGPVPCTSEYRLAHARDAEHWDSETKS
jgi:hypothetical protein